MSIHFSKMQALGNDFVVINATTQSISITKAFIQSISDRHYGVGCDQVLVLTVSKNKKADFGYRIFNADGNEVYQCGNGARCMGLFIQLKKLSDKKIIFLETHQNTMRVECLDNKNIKVDIAKPNFDSMSLPFKTDEKEAPYHLQLKNKKITFDVVSVGNPHCLLRGQSFTETEMIDVGEQLNAHPAFPEGVNVGFVLAESLNKIQLRVYERGVGMTKACGSGACAAVAVCYRQQGSAVDVEVQQIGGSVCVIWQSLNDSIQLYGSAAHVFEGKLTHTHTHTDHLISH